MDDKRLLGRTRDNCDSTFERVAVARRFVSGGLAGLAAAEQFSCVWTYVGTEEAASYVRDPRSRRGRSTLSAAAIDLGETAPDDGA